MSKTDFCVVHVFPYTAKLAGGHSNATIAFMEGQMRQGINVQGVSPVAKSIRGPQWRSIDHLPIREIDFGAPDLCQRALELTEGYQQVIFHFHGFERRFVPFGRDLVKAGIPYVVTSQGQLHYREVMHWAKKFIYINLVGRFFRDASGLHFLTQKERDRCRYLLSFQHKLILTQGNVVEVPDRGAVSAAAREQYGIPAAAFLFAYFGRLHIETKGLDVLLKSFAGLPLETNPCLVFIGPDWAGGKDRLERLARQLKCDGRVRFLGPHFDDRKWELLGMADGFVAPSRWEAFGIAIVEAMGFGLPTIVSRKMNPASEWVAAGAAIAVDPSPSALGQAMRLLASDPHLRQSLSESGRRWVREECSPQQAGIRFRDFYLQLLRAEKVAAHPVAQPRARRPLAEVRAAINVVHVFPYSPTISGGHSNAIRGFIACQQAKQINAVGIAPKPDGAVAQQEWGFPLAEVDRLWDLRWTDIARRFSLTPGDSIVHFHSVNLRFGAFLGDLHRAGIPHVLTSQGQLNFRGALHGFKKFIYLNCLDRGPRNAAGLHILTPAADRRLQVLLPGYRGLKLIQGNVVQVPSPGEFCGASKSSYGVPQEACLLVFLGRLDVRVKGLDVLVEAFSYLPADRFHLVMAGPDWEGGRAKLERLAARLGCGDRIQLVGPVYGAQKWSLLRMADLFVSPSRWEAFSVAHAEVLALGVPVVTSNRITIASDLREADAALMVPVSAEMLAKAIATLAADPQRRQALSIRAKAWAEKNCSPDRAGARFQEFYQAILDRTHGAAA